MSFKGAVSVYDSIFNKIIYSIANGDDVQLTGFGSFKLHDYPVRLAQNFKTDKRMPIDTNKTVIFKSGRTFKWISNQ